MGNDMYNDEQLAHAEIVQKETEDALGWWKDRALKAEAKLADKYLIEEQYEAACGDRDGLLRMVETLREWKDKLEAERDDIAACAESWMKRVAAAERERDDFVEKLKAAHKREDGYRIERDALLAKAAPHAAPLDHVAFLTGLPVELNSLLPEGSIFMHPRTFNGFPAEHPSWLDRMRAEAKTPSALDGDGRDGFNGDGPFEG